MKLPGAERVQVTEARMIEELEDVILTCDLPAQGLARGDIGTVVLVHKGGKGYEVEFTTLDGKTVAVVTLNAKQVRHSKPREIAHVRVLAANS
jgi:ATP-dependent exoDNAse (exonuclease V) alpha subunit